jgi:hypothetical protein
MADRMHELGGAEAPPTSSHLVYVRERAASIAEDFRDRRGEGSIELVSAGCADGCAVCFRECAIRRIHADLWAEKVARLEVEEGQVLTHNGVTYAEPQGRA